MAIFAFMPNLNPADPDLFFSRQDPADPRLGEMCAPPNDDSSQISILGYPDDEGVQINGGRIGAKSGPAEIRRWLYRMTPHPKLILRSFRDVGDIPSAPLSLPERHDLAIRCGEGILQNGGRLLSFGGGNDYAYCDGLAFLKVCEGSRRKPLIINVDAHLDVRDTSRGFSSGTPFYRLLESGLHFDFVEFGIQTHCNSSAHWDYVIKNGGKIITTDEIADSGLSLQDYSTRALGDWLLHSRPAFLAIDIDAFAWPYAVGASAAWPWASCRRILCPH
ncbi:MAG: formimidoylglutamase [Calothrix sp. SM1_5_4]|nr:formimidoylglutamase [Calothrix sp. SM1_5_4]